jgi:hypothetical protein
MGGYGFRLRKAAIQPTSAGAPVGLGASGGSSGGMTPEAARTISAFDQELASNLLNREGCRTPDRALSRRIGRLHLQPIGARRKFVDGDFLPNRDDGVSRPAP